MRRLSRFLMFVGLVTLTAIAVVWFRLDAIAQTSLEDSLTRVLGVPTQMSALSINKFAGTARIQALEIDNPDGFSAPHIFQVQQIDVDFAPLSLFGSTLEIHRLKLDRISVDFEQRLQDNNILKIVEFVKGRNRSQSDLDFAQPQVRSAQISFKGKRFEIATVNLDNIAVEVSFAPLGNIIPFGGLSQSFEVTIPDIELANINSDNAELVLEGTLDEVVSGLLGDLAGGIFQEVPRQMESDEAQGIFGELLEQLPF